MLPTFIANASYGERIIQNDHTEKPKFEEVDFYFPSEGLGIQVAYSLQDEKALEREVTGLKVLNEKHSLKKLMIITRDEKDEIELNPKTKIEVVPVWQWLLEGNDK